MKAVRLAGANHVLARLEAPHGCLTISRQAERDFLERLPEPANHTPAAWQGPAADPRQDVQQEFPPRLSIPSENEAKTAWKLIDRQAEPCRDDLRPRSRKTHAWPGRAPPQGCSPPIPGQPPGRCALQAEVEQNPPAALSPFKPSALREEPWLG